MSLRAMVSMMYQMLKTTHYHTEFMLAPITMRLLKSVIYIKGTMDHIFVANCAHTHQPPCILQHPTHQHVPCISISLHQLCMLVSYIALLCTTCRLIIYMTVSLGFSTSCQLSNCRTNIQESARNLYRYRKVYLSSLT